MSIVKFYDELGQECSVHWPPGDLSEVEQIYHDCSCQCSLCREGKNMNVREEVHAKVKKFQMDHNEPSYKTALDRVFGADPTLKQRYAESSPGQEVDEQELSKHKAGQTLKNLALQHQQRKGGSFVDALHAVAPICPGEIKAYLNLEFPPVTSASSYGSKGGGNEASELWFRERAGWTAGGVRDWLKQQELAGGELARNEGGWSYTPQKRT